MTLAPLSAAVIAVAAPAPPKPRIITSASLSNFVSAAEATAGKVIAPTAPAAADFKSERREKSVIIVLLSFLSPSAVNRRPKRPSGAPE